jgi:hypothetical protein
MSIYLDEVEAAERPPAEGRRQDAKLAARRNKLLALWAAGHMGLSDQAGARYALGVVSAELREQDDAALVTRVTDDLVARGYPITEEEVARELARCAEAACQELGLAGVATG